jgi:alpha,alpha-trehalase
MQGLAASNRYDLIENMLDNFAYLINVYGHIPNGNRNYYLGRSQPPYFALMVDILQQKKGKTIYKKYLGALQKEYAFWMEGEKKVKEGTAHRRVVKLSNGTILNRYFDDSSKPRQESYYEDVQTGLVNQNPDGEVYRHLRAGAESGWDFSSRWFEDTLHLNTIETTSIVPVDLNCLMYAYEQVLAKALKTQNQVAKANTILNKAANRKEAILKYCWNESLQSFFDYDFKQSSTTNKYSLAVVLPLFVKIANKAQAEAVRNLIEQRFLKDGGVVTSLYHTGEQWDAPNGWAPLEFNTVQSLMNYGYKDLAATIAERWMKLNEKVYNSTGKMLEKYNVEDINVESGGGEYPTQDGFGWTNGVYLKFYQMFRGK